MAESWSALLDRAAGEHVTVGEIRATLAERRADP